MGDGPVSFADFAALFGRREEQEAERAGLSLEEYRARAEAEQRREEAEREARRLEMLRNSAARALSNRLGASIDHARTVVDGRLQPSEAVRHVESWAATDAPALVLCGGVGAGKTTAAMLAAWLVTGDRVTTDAWEAVPAAMLGRSADPWKQDREAGIEQANLRAALFILDDLGTERSDDARFSEALFRLVDGRQDSRFRTLITTNLGRADIRPRYGDRIADRLNHIGRAVEIKGASMRRKGSL
jgi:DNA replication protein DnaC